MRHGGGDDVAYFVVLAAGQKPAGFARFGECVHVTVGDTADLDVAAGREVDVTVAESFRHVCEGFPLPRGNPTARRAHAADASILGFVHAQSARAPVGASAVAKVIRISYRHSV